MTDPIQKESVGTAEQEFLHTLELPGWLAGLRPGVPTNIVGSPAGIATMADALAALPEARAIQTAGPAADGTDAAGSIGARVAAEMLPGGRTIMLDPIAAHHLLLAGKPLEEVALRTREALYLPLFVTPAPFRLFYSEGFSFEEPAFDDAAEHRWCWNTSRAPSSVYVQSAESLAGRQISFDVACGNIGTLVCRVDDQVHAFHCGVAGASQRLSFGLTTPARIARIDIEFDGEPFLPDGGLDQRRALYYSFGGVVLSPVPGSAFAAPPVRPPESIAALDDRAIRRLLHAAGFYEILGLATPWQPALSFLHARSCFDYQAGFAFRDVYGARGPALSCGPAARHYAPPLMLYQARRMPSPGSEWTRSSDRLRSLPS